MMPVMCHLKGEGALYMGPSTLVPLYTPTDLYFIFARGALKILANVGQTF